MKTNNTPDSTSSRLRVVAPDYQPTITESQNARLLRENRRLALRVERDRLKLRRVLIANRKLVAVINAMRGEQS